MLIKQNILYSRFNVPGHSPYMFCLGVALNPLAQKLLSLWKGYVCEKKSYVKDERKGIGKGKGGVSTVECLF